MIPSDRDSGKIFEFIMQQYRLFPLLEQESSVFPYIIGVIYFIFGFFPLGVRIFNIALSILASYFSYSIAKKQFNEKTANIVLVVTLFMPAQIIYSITLSRDLIRMFPVMLIMWLIYGGVVCKKVSKK